MSPQELNRRERVKPRGAATLAYSTRRNRGTLLLVMQARRRLLAVLATATAACSQTTAVAGGFGDAPTEWQLWMLVLTPVLGGVAVAITFLPAPSASVAQVVRATPKKILDLCRVSQPL